MGDGPAERSNLCPCLDQLGPQSGCLAAADRRRQQRRTRVPFRLLLSVYVHSSALSPPAFSRNEGTSWNCFVTDFFYRPLAGRGAGPYGSALLASSFTSLTPHDHDVGAHSRDPFSTVGTGAHLRPRIAHAVWTGAADVPGVGSQHSKDRVRTILAPRHHSLSPGRAAAHLAAFLCVFFRPPRSIQITEAWCRLRRLPISGSDNFHGAARSLFAMRARAELTRLVPREPWAV